MTRRAWRELRDELSTSGQKIQVYMICKSDNGDSVAYSREEALHSPRSLVFLYQRDECINDLSKRFSKCHLGLVPVMQSRCRDLRQISKEWEKGNVVRTSR